MKLALQGLILMALAAGPQAQAQQSSDRPAGLETEWDISVVLQEIGAHAARLAPVLEKVKVQQWVDKGASETYAVQLESSKQQVRAIENAAKALAANPEKLPASLELYLRINGLEDMLATLEEGTRRYQNAEDAQSLASVAAENGRNRDRFMEYIVNLASDRERQLEVMDREAQRCRGMLATQPPRASERKK